MKFTVLWKPSAGERLAEIWLNAPDRSAVAEAADKIDRLLRTDPLGQGESRSDRERIVIVSPVVAAYEVSVEDRVVRVLAVRHVPTRPASE